MDLAAPGDPTKTQNEIADLSCAYEAGAEPARAQAKNASETRAERPHLAPTGAPVNSQGLPAPGDRAKIQNEIADLSCAYEAGAEPARAQAKNASETRAERPHLAPTGAPVNSQGLPAPGDRAKCENKIRDESPKIDEGGPGPNDEGLAAGSEVGVAGCGVFSVTIDSRAKSTPSLLSRPSRMRSRRWSLLRKEIGRKSKTSR